MISISMGSKYAFPVQQNSLKLESVARHQLARSQGIYDMVLAVTRKSDVRIGDENPRTER